jgi:AraC-like DNA-binding protein
MKSFSRYLPINDETFSSPLFLTSAGRVLIPPGASYPPPGHPDLYHFSWEEGRVLPEFSLFCVEAGSGVWETRHGSFPIHAGQVGQVFPGAWHRYRPTPSTGWTECWIQFNGQLAHEFWEKGLFAEENPVRTPCFSERFFRQFRELAEDIRSPDLTNSPFLGLRVAGLLGLLYQPETETSGGSTLVEKALHHIWNYSHRQLGVSEVARRLGVSRRTLERAFLAEGRSAGEEISLCRLNRAERLLRETRLPLKNIATLAGFGTTEQMRLRFQAKHRMSPGHYRSLLAPS